MSAKSSIEWTDATWNPLVGCTKVSPGCDHCYAETLVNRFAGKNSGFPNRFDVVTMRGEKMLTQPMRWRKPKRVFVNSLSDLFHQDVPDEFIAKVFAVMALAPQHTFQLLTKRHGRMRLLLNSAEFRLLVCEVARTDFDLNWEAIERVDRVVLAWPLRNVWLGVSVENQQWADIRIPALLDTPAAIRFLSCEPLLGPIDLDQALGWRRARGCLNAEYETRIKHQNLARALDWVIVGGESGHGARPMQADWARSLRDQCTAAGVAFLFKQWGNFAPSGYRVTGTSDGEMVYMGKKEAGRELDGRTWDEYPVAPVTAAVRGGSATRVRRSGPGRAQLRP